MDRGLDYKRIAVFLLSLAHFGSSELPCAQTGECLGAEFIREISATTVEECADLCREESLCRNFNYYMSEQQCFLLANNCDSISDSFCSDCLTGNRNCDLPACWLRGVQAKGSFAGHAIVDSPEECHIESKKDQRFKWFTFDKSGDRTCVFFSDKTDLVPCTTCVTGESICASRKEWRNVLIVGGNDPVFSEDDELLQVESVNLQYEKYRCNSTIPDFPFTVKHLVGAFIGGAAVVCGGRREDNSDECWTLNANRTGWDQSLRYPYGAVGYMGSILLSESKWWLSGGSLLTEDGKIKVLAESAIYNGLGVFETGPQLPVPLETHCVAKINDTHFFLGGGYNAAEERSDRAWLMSMDDQFPFYHWTELDPMPFARSGHFCHFNPAKNEIHVGAGKAVDSASEITQKTAVLDLGTLEWRVGGDFPRGDTYLLYPGYVEDVGDSVTLGGDDKWVGYKDILGFYNDGRDEYYYDPKRGMAVGRSGMAAFKVPDTIAPCDIWMTVQTRHERREPVWQA